MLPSQLQPQSQSFTHRGAALHSLAAITTLLLEVYGADMENNTPGQQGDVWSWVVIGLVFCAVTVALFGPFIWELTHSV